MSTEETQKLQELAEEPISHLHGHELAVLPPARRPRVVVVGAGFGGLNLVNNLANSEVDVLLLDRNNYHGFWPLLYQVATAGLEPSTIAYPLRAIVRRHPNVAFELANVTGVAFEAREVHADEGATYPYDYLVLAAGSATNYFGNNALHDTTYELKDLADAEALRNCILSAFEAAMKEPDAKKRQALLTFVIVGGGPTGVELAGAIAELIRFVLRKDYPMLDLTQAHVVLVEATDKILLAFPEQLQKAAAKRLRRMGVKIKLSSPVDKVQNSYVYFKDGSRLASNTIVWAAGVRASLLADKLGVPQARGARVKIEPTLNLKDRPEVFVIGDMSYLEGFKGDATMAYPQVAQVAIQQGKQGAENILALTRGSDPKEFSYADKGNMATIGRRSAILDAYGIQLYGFLAWLGWLLVHIYYLIGFRNRLVVLLNWIYYYLTYERGVRLITWTPPED